MRATDAPIPLSAQAPGYPAAVTACAARLQTRFLALRLSLPLVAARPSGLRIRSALQTGSPMISLELEHPAAKARWGGRILRWILAGESDLAEYSPLVARTGTGPAATSPVPHGMAGAGRLPVYITTIPRSALRVTSLRSAHPGIGVM